jgi:hypothetical protein
VSQAIADHDFLFGLLAMQDGLINQGELKSGDQALVTLEQAKTIPARGRVTVIRAIA